MCGRFHNHLKAMHDWVDVLKGWQSDDPRLSYNVSPTAEAPILTDEGFVNATWGLVPSWSDEFPSKFSTFNARVETAHTKPVFRSAWKYSRTCALPVGGYYEWKKEGNTKQPYLFHQPDNILMLAGLWERWNDKISFTILTQDSYGKLTDIHHRMPMFLDPESTQDWLTKGTTIIPDSKHFNQIEYIKVSTRVNNSRNDGADLIEPVE